MNVRQGFTLLEILVVLAIIGILLGIFGLNLIRSIRTAELREAATQVATDFRRARAQAQRGSVGMTVSVLRTGGNTYTVTSLTGGTKSRAVPNNVTLKCKTNCGTGLNTAVSYQAPYGELGATGSVFTLQSPVIGIQDLEIRIVGVTGKVILTKAS